MLLVTMMRISMMIAKGCLTFMLQSIVFLGRRQCFYYQTTYMMSTCHLFPGGKIESFRKLWLLVDYLELTLNTILHTTRNEKRPPLLCCPITTGQQLYHAWRIQNFNCRGAIGALRRAMKQATTRVVFHSISAFWRNRRWNGLGLRFIGGNPTYFSTDFSNLFLKAAGTNTFIVADSTCLCCLC